MPFGKVTVHPRGGCLAKLPAIRLQALLEKAYEDVFGAGSWHPMQQPEDAASLAIAGSRVLVSTDFAPPIGVNCVEAGRIAALHAMSDIYACGGVPKWAFAIVMLVDTDAEVGGSLLSGMLRACRDEDVEIRGGHTVSGSETMIGLTVIGSPRDGVVLGKQGAQAGDRLLLSKPLGNGMLMKARALGLADDDGIAEALQQMSVSNREAASRAIEAQVHAATDVSGFGLLGHLSEMLGPEQGATLNLASIPILHGAASLPHHVGCALADSNLWYVRSRLRLDGFQENSRFFPLADPQTNGGLLVAADEVASSGLMNAGFHLIGTVNDTAHRIVITD